MNNLLLLYGCLWPDGTLIMKNKCAPVPGEHLEGRNRTMRRTLVLNEDDLIMVIKDDVVKQID